MAVLAEHGGELAALVGALLWAIASVVYSDIGRHIPPRELNLAKGVLALAMLGLTILVLGDSFPSNEPLALGLLLVSGAIGIGGSHDEVKINTLRRTTRSNRRQHRCLVAGFVDGNGYDFGVS